VSGAKARRSAQVVLVTDIRLGRLPIATATPVFLRADVDAYVGFGDDDSVVSWHDGEDGVGDEVDGDGGCESQESGGD
jgi:hypothetical protein